MRISGGIAELPAATGEEPGASDWIMVDQERIGTFAAATGPEAMPREVFAQREAAIPMKRAGEPGEVAGAVLFLASDLSSYLTGAVPEVGGGRSM